MPTQDPAAKTRISGTCIVLGVGGSIAAYKAASLVRRLREQAADVHVVLTAAAQQFITPLTFRALSGNVVHTDLFHGDDPLAHIRLADQADLILIAPATANLLGRLAHGLADDLLTTLVTATRAMVMVVPAMDGGMWDHPMVQRNVETLRCSGVIVLDPEHGALASGRIGIGRLPSEDVILSAALDALNPQRDYQGETILITAGPTQEAIDPIRFLSNRSSGKMGVALAEAARRRGAQVTLVLGPTTFPSPRGVTVIPVISAEEMRQATEAHFDRASLVIMAAAVSDYRPAQHRSTKIKKQDNPGLFIELVPTDDILAGLGKKKNGQYLVGFSAETGNLLDEATRKLHDKGLDLIVANDVTEKGAGFEWDTNKVIIVEKNGDVVEFPLMSKRELSMKLLDLIRSRMKRRVGLGTSA